MRSSLRPIEHPHRRRGFTLAEMVVSVAVTGVLMVSIGAAMVIAARSLPDPKVAPNTTLAGTSALNELGDDLSYATRLTERSATALTFTVADRNDADSNAETIRYAWSGTVGDPMTRSYNGGTPVTVIPSVRSLTFSYQTRTVTESYEAKSVESAEFELKSNDSSSNTDTAHVHPNAYTGQYIIPNLPAGAKSWSVTRVMYRAIYDNTAGDSTLYVQLRPAASDKRPTLTVLDQTSRPESNFGSEFQWFQSSFTGTGAAGMEPTQPVVLVFLTGPTNENAGQIELNKSGVSAANAGVEEYAGSSPEDLTKWKAATTASALRYYAYGKAVAPPSGAANLSATRTYVTAVRVTVNPANATDSPFDVTFQVANEPEVLEAAFDADFSTDPTTVDNNGDGVAEWKLRADNTLSVSSFAGGLWTATGTGALDTQSAAPPALAGVTTATARFRDTTSGDGGVSFRLNAGRSSGSIAPIVATLTLQSTGSQKLSLAVINADGTLATVYTCSNLPSTLNTVRLLADASQQTVNLRVNDDELGTFGYRTRATGASTSDLVGASVLLEGGTSAEVDSVSVHAGRAP